jgi:hypothetical protein
MLVKACAPPAAPSGWGSVCSCETGRATGWLARAQRLLAQRDCVEQGYLLLPVAEQCLAEDNGKAAYTTALSAAEIGERFSEADLIACARHVQGRALIHQGQVQAGLALLDEAMVAVTVGELSPIMTGLIYCSVIEVCQQAYALDRAREWTSALAQWCAQQPEMIAFTTTCLVHRLRGEFTAAEEAYRHASQGGWEPQPGLALLWLAQGRMEAADAAIRRVLSVTTDPRQRTKLLPAGIEIRLAVGAIPEARDACGELEGSRSASA